MGNTVHKQKSNESDEIKLIKKIKEQQRTHKRIKDADRPESVIMAYLDC